MEPPHADPQPGALTPEEIERAVRRMSTPAGPTMVPAQATTWTSTFSLDDLRRAQEALAKTRPIEPGAIIAVCHPDDRLDLVTQLRECPVKVHVIARKRIPRGHPEVYFVERPPTLTTFIPEIPPMNVRNTPADAALALGYTTNPHLQGRVPSTCPIGRDCPCSRLDDDIARTGSCAAGVIIRRTVDL